MPEEPSPTALTIERTFAAPVDAVFSAWSQNKLLARWIWGPYGLNALAEVDFRPGGAYRVFAPRPDGEVWKMSGEYLEIEPNSLIVCSLQWDAPMGYEAPNETLTVEFLPEGEKTRMIFRHGGIPDVAKSEHEKGWNACFDALDKILRH